MRENWLETVIFCKETKLNRKFNIISIFRVKLRNRNTKDSIGYSASFQIIRFRRTKTQKTTKYLTSWSLVKNYRIKCKNTAVQVRAYIHHKWWWWIQATFIFLNFTKFGLIQQGPAYRWRRIGETYAKAYVSLRNRPRIWKLKLFLLASGVLVKGKR